MKVIIVATVYPTRAQALALLEQYIQNEFLLKHALAVEAVMRHFAGLFGEDVEKWGVIGLVHDLDYEKYPEEHCTKVREILKERNWPEEYIRAIVSHGWQICSEVEPRERMEKVLYTIDELTGLITAAVLVRPDKNLLNLEVKSVKKKWKEKSFAAGVNREVINQGAAMLGMELQTVMAETIRGMQNVVGELGLDGKE
ncbi:MAG: HDIG domain-containing protein [Bacillota bacterium]|jgi:putative nucleotidyltransferase with HDIG domain